MVSKARNRNPLAPSVYLIRNAGKALPLVAVIVLAVLLIAGIVSMVNSIPYSIRTIYDYSRRHAGITPRGDPTLTPVLKEKVERESPVELGRVMTIRGTDTVIRSIVGKWPFVVLALSPSDIDYYLSQMNVSEISGAKPRDGEPEVIISDPVAKNLNLKLGSVLLGPEVDDGYSPKNVKVVGIAHTDKWLMLIPRSYHEKYHFPPIDALLVFAKDPAQQEQFDRWAKKAFNGERARVLIYDGLDKDTNEMFNILYSILNVVIGTLVVVITVMIGMLMNIYQSQRIQEFALLQALGYARSTLLRRVVLEAVLVVIGGWILGVGVAYGLLRMVKALLMDPQAFALNPLDRAAYLYTIPVPVAIMAAAIFTVWIHFKRFDPVGVVERRLV
ncbi:MAG: ABC transporter permease [Armatimonadetes bacterium]|nr:ABC transporter permease [Armatimonadota bacterium]